jgi:hypothetical protein
MLLKFEAPSCEVSLPQIMTDSSLAWLPLPVGTEGHFAVGITEFWHPTFVETGSVSVFSERVGEAPTLLLSSGRGSKKWDLSRSEKGEIETAEMRFLRACIRTCTYTPCTQLDNTQCVTNIFLK